MDVRGRMGTPYYLQGTPGVEEASALSGYWIAPEGEYDPRLMDARGKVSPMWRQDILGILYGFWAEKGYASPEVWSTVWIAGSAITKQWRKPDDFGDLDVLIGVDMAKFVAMNPSYTGLTEAMIASHFNAEFREEIHPQTADYNGFEITFYVNQGAADIRDINPYAAFNLTTDEWTVDPIELPEDWDPDAQIPDDWWQAVQAEVDTVRQQHDLLNSLVMTAAEHPPGDPRWVTVNSQAARTAKAAADLFSSIHDDRRKAFSPKGQGYLDFFNFRWQAHKRYGTVKYLHWVKNQLSEQHTDNELQVYGYEIDDPQTALEKALWSQKRTWG